MLLRLLMIVSFLKQTNYYIKICEIEKKNTDHGHSNKYITTQESDKLM